MMDFSEFDQFEEYRLLNDNCQHPVILLKHQKTGAFFVQKEVPVTMMPVFLELQKRSQMIHSGLPEIIGLMEMGEHLFVIEKYIEGKNLEDDIRDHFLLQEEGIRIILRLCEILETLHGQDPPMIHRDIKPSNVILGHDGGVFLIDFGASRFVKDGVESDTVFLGTTGYASPEQYGFHQSDQRSDIYSLGILLNVLLTGKYPNEKMANAPFDQVIQKCTQIEPKDRYQNVRQLKQALKRANTLAERKSTFHHHEDIYKWLLPGFRTGRTWKMLTAVLGYLLIFYLAFTSTTKEEPLPLWSKAIFFLCLFFMVLLFFNYRNIYQKLPFLNHRKYWVRIIALVVYEAILFFTMAMLAGIGTFITG